MINKKPKIDLLSFQKGLNEKFLKIIQDRKDFNFEASVINENLGLTDDIGEIVLFFPLKDLRKISSDNKIEPIHLTSAWISGFNQIRGEVFTIIDLSKIIKWILTDEFDEKRKEINTNSSVIYVRDIEDYKLGFLLKSSNMENVEDFQKLCYTVDTEQGFKWECAENTDFEILTTDILVNEREEKILKDLHESINTEKVFSPIDVSFDIEKEKHISYLTKTVYIDGTTRRPIFVIDIERLTKFLILVSPF